MLKLRSNLGNEIVRSAERDAKQEASRKTALKALIVFIAVMLVLTIASRALSELSVALVTTTSPQRGTLERQVTADGTLSTSGEIPFWMSTVYRVSDIYVHIGDEVNVGDPLFAFDMEQLQSQLSDAEVALEKQINNRDRSLINTQVSAPDTSVSDAERTLNRQQENYAQTAETQDRNVANAEADLATAYTSLSKAQAEYDQEVATQTQDTQTTAYESYVKAQQALVNAQNAYTIAQLNAQDSENKAQSKLDAAYDAGDAAAIYEASLGLDIALSNNNSNLLKAQQTLDNAQNDYNKAWNSLNNIDVTSKVASKKSALESAEKDVTNKQTALDNAIRTRETSLRDAQRQLDDAQTSYDKAVASANAKKKSESATKESDALSQANTELDIAVQQEKVDDLKALVETGGVVTSTVAGKVTAINVSQYATPSTNNPLISFTNDSSSLKLSIQVSKTNADYMTVGDEVTITLADNGFARTQIAEINAVTGNTDAREVVVYLNPSNGAAGDKVRFRFSKRTDNYDSLIPIAALRQDNVGYFVYVLRQEEGALGARMTVERADVTVIDQDSSRAAVSGGVARNDLLVERSDRSLSEGDRVRTE